MSKDFETIFREFANTDTFVLSRGLLEDYKRQAAQAEQERIIKLLEENDHYSIDWLIELIKGKTE